MENQTEPRTPFYPAPPTVPDDITPADQAIYVPAITPGFAKSIYAWTHGTDHRALPGGTKPDELNILDPANSDFFRISHALTSAGLALNQNSPCIITERDKGRTKIFADSGGYQVASNTLIVQSDADRERIMRWQEQFDICMTLDVPTGPLRKPGYSYRTFADCLTATLTHLDFYENNKKTESVWWLNVLQGNDQKQCDIWYQQVRKRFRGDGWAFAGPLRHNFYQLLRRLILMHQDGELQEKRWIHILGTSELDTAVLLTALQRAIVEHMKLPIRISYDTSSPFRNLAWNQAYTLPTFDTESMTMPTRDAPDDPSYIGSSVRWPWPSPIGNRMVMDDFCVPKSQRSRRYRDVVSNHLLAHHNLYALCWGIAQANRVFDAENVTHEHTIAEPVGFAAEAIEEIVSTRSLTLLDRRQFVFEGLRHGRFDYDSEAQRVVPDPGNGD